MYYWYPADAEWLACLHVCTKKKSRIDLKKSKKHGKSTYHVFNMLAIYSDKKLLIINSK